MKKELQLTMATSNCLFSHAPENPRGFLIIYSGLYRDIL